MKTTYLFSRRKQCLYLFLMMILFFGSGNLQGQQVATLEYEALVALYNATHGETWYNQWDVSQNNLHTNPWYGVTTENGHVTKIELYGNGLYGELPEKIGNLTYLKELILTNNYYYVGYPDGYKYLGGNLPASFSKLSNLTKLDLSSNRFSATILTDVCKLVKLEYLRLYNNMLSGTIPAEINNLTQLKRLEINYNQLSGTIPALSKLTKLEVLYLDYNKFEALTSALPADIYYLSMSYQTLSRDNFHYTGDAVTITLPNICMYDYNNKTFTATNSFGLIIAGSFVGDYITANSNGTLTIPASYLSALRTGQKVSIYQYSGTAYGTSINFENTIISNLSQVPDIEYKALVALYNATHGETWNNKWDVSVNNLHESPWYGISIESGHITKLYLSYNGLYGTLPDELGNLTYLKELNLSGNYNYVGYPENTYKYLEGNIPASFSKLSQLSVLNLSSNKFLGNIPSAITGLTKLTNLNLSSNNFAGNIPAAIGNMSALVEINLSYNQLTGKVPFLSNYATIQRMYFNNNKLNEISTDFKCSSGSLYLSYQTIEYNEPLSVDGNMVTLNLPNICRYDAWNNSFNAQNGFNIYFNNDYKGYVTANASGQLFFTATYFDGMEVGDIIKITQGDGTAYGTQLLFRSLSTMTTPLPDIEYKALVALYNATGGANWKNKWNVSQNNLHTLYWYGVSINQGHVVGIELPDNNLTGNIPAALKDLTHLKTLNLSKNSIVSIESALSSTITTLSIGQSFNKGELNLNGNVQIKDIPAILTYNHPTQNFGIIPTFNLYSSNYGYCFNSLTAAEAANWFNKLIDGNCSRFSVGHTIELRQTNGSAVNSSLCYTVSFKPGDANVDGIVNVLDVQQTLNHILLNFPVPFNYGAANLNNDATVNVQDLVMMVNLIQANPLQAGSSSLKSANEYAELQIENGIVYLSTPVEIAALDIRISGASVESIKELVRNREIQFFIQGMTGRNQISVVAFSLSGSVIPAGRTPLFTIGSEQVIEQAVLATQSAQSIEVRISNAPTKLDDTSVDNFGVFNAPNPFEMETEFVYYLPETVVSVQIRIYNTQGQLVEVINNMPVTQGKHKVTYTNNRLSTGIYYYEWEAVRENKQSIRQTNKLWIKK